MTRHQLNRRSFLHGAAGAAAGLPLLTSLMPRSARANTVGFPRRLIIFFHPNGTNPDNWFPTPGATESDFTFSGIHQPLVPFKQDVIMLGGVDMKSLSIGPGEEHQRGMGAVLTGSHLQEGSFVGGDGSLAGWAAGISIDQHVANAVGTQTRFKSLELGVLVNGSEVRHRINYAGPGQPLPPRENPGAVFQEVFSGSLQQPDFSSTLLARRRSVLSTLNQQFVALRPRVSSNDREKLERHLDMVRDLEMRLEAVGGGATCEVPAAPTSLDPWNEQVMTTVSNLQIDLMVMAMACDLTRVATLQHSSAANHLHFPFMSPGDDDHGLSHTGPTDTAAQEKWAARHRWYAGQFAYLLGKLKSIPEGDGTMLDNCAILWCSELAIGNTHKHYNMPFVLAGRAGGAWRTGRYLRFDSKPHNDLLVSIMNAMGVAGTSFGDPEFCTGPLPGLTA